MKHHDAASLSEKDWLNALFSSTTKVGLELAGHHFRLAPEPGWNTANRLAKEHLVYFVMEGGCSAVLDGKRVSPTAGALCWMCPNTPFRFVHRAKDSPLVIYRFRFTVERGTRALRPGWSFRFLPETWRLLETIKQIILEAESPGRLGAWRVRSLLSLLSITVFEGSPARKRRGTFLDETQRAKIANWLAEHAAQRATPADLALQLDYSPAYFTRIFRRSYGQSPRTWLLQQRLRHAAVLLRESSSRVSDIALKLGYSEVYLFSRQFRMMFGTGPRQWRKSGG